MNSPFKPDEKALLLLGTSELTYQGKTFVCPQFYFECQGTGQEFTTTEIDELNLRIVKTVSKHPGGSMNQTEESKVREAENEIYLQWNRLTEAGKRAKLALLKECVRHETTNDVLSAILTKIQELNYITYDRSDLSTGIAYDEDDLKSLIEEELKE